MNNKTKLTFDKLQVQNKKRCEKHFHKIDDWTPTDWACAMGGECGEALNLIKKLRRITGNTNKDTLSLLKNPNSYMLIDEIGKELADIVIYADLLATRLGLKLDECVQHKFNITSNKIKSKIKL